MGGCRMKRYGERLQWLGLVCALAMLTWAAGCSKKTGTAKMQVHKPGPQRGVVGSETAKSPAMAACPKVDRNKLDEGAIPAFLDPEGRKRCKANLLDPTALAIGEAGRVWVVLGQPMEKLAGSGPITLESKEGTSVVMSRALGYGAPRGMAVQVLGSKGLLCQGVLGPPVVLARLTSPSVSGLASGGPGGGRGGAGAPGSHGSGKGAAVKPGGPGDQALRDRSAGRRVAAGAQAQGKLAELWSSAGLVVAAPVKGCKLSQGRAGAGAGPGAGSGSGPVLAVDTQAAGRVKLAKKTAVDSEVRAEALARLRDLLGVDAKHRRARPKDVSVRGLAMPRGGMLLAVGAAWQDWPVCGAKGWGGSALWYLFRGQWHLLEVWKGIPEAVQLLMAGDLTGKGGMECVVQEATATGKRVLYRIQNRESSDEGELVPLRFEESAVEGCGC